jgi:hypothetical protein
VVEFQIIAQFEDDTSLSTLDEEAPVLATHDILHRFYITYGLFINEARAWLNIGTLGIESNFPGSSLSSGKGEVGDLSRLLGTLFGLTLTTSDATEFLLGKLDKKLACWSIQKQQGKR